MKNERKTTKLTDLMVLIVFCVFAVCILAVLLTGAQVYKELVDRGDGYYDQRTAVQYISTRVRQADRAGSVTVEDFDGQEALVLREQIDGSVYLTRVYCYDGFIRELFTTESGSFSPEDGEKLLQVQNLSFRLEGTLLSARIGFSDGTTQALTLCLRSAEEANP